MDELSTSGNLIHIISLYIIFSLIGWIFEYIAFNKSGPDRLIRKYTEVNLPLLQIYGLGAVILYLIHKKMSSSPLWQKLTVAYILINLMECVMGQLSYQSYGVQTWKYDDNLLPSCDGYVSVGTSIFWLFLSYVGFWALDRFD